MLADRAPHWFRLRGPGAGIRLRGGLYQSTQ
jgi:hypothetical protein